MSVVEKAKRITFKHRNPNPLFQSWLQELYEEAKEKNSKLQFMLKEALTSLSKYPLPLQSGAECAVLKGFETKLCIFLDKRLEVYNSNLSNGENINLPSTSQSLSNDNSGSSGSNDKSLGHNNENDDVVCLEDNVSSTPRQLNDEVITHSSKHSDNLPVNSGDSSVIVSSTTSRQSSTQKSKRSKGEPYTPKYRSGGYALLLALLNHINKNPSRLYMTKKDLLVEAQPFCEESFTRRKPNTWYTTWNSMGDLIKRGLVLMVRRSQRPAEYSLTDEGLILATKLLEINESTLSANDLMNIKMTSYNVENNDQDEDQCVVQDINDDVGVTDMCVVESVQIDETIYMPIGSFDVILLIDKQEASGDKKKAIPTDTQFKKYPDVQHEYRNLKVGDFTWVARSKINNKEELVLPYIIERKRMDDLASSIKDGRYHEQKFRLSKCNIENVIYLVENYGSNQHLGMPLTSLMQATHNTRAQDNFRVHFTASLNHTVQFLAIMTKRLCIEYKNKSLKGDNKEPSDDRLMTFQFFNKSSVKNKSLTVNQTFTKLLMQLKGVTVEKALAITNVYKTPQALIEAYRSCSKSEGELLLATLKHGDLQKNVGPVISKSVYQFFTTVQLI